MQSNSSPTDSPLSGTIDYLNCWRNALHVDLDKRTIANVPTSNAILGITINQPKQQSPEDEHELEWHKDKCAWKSACTEKPQIIIDRIHAPTTDTIQISITINFKNKSSSTKMGESMVVAGYTEEQIQLLSGLFELLLMRMSWMTFETIRMGGSAMTFMCMEREHEALLQYLMRSGVQEQEQETIAQESTVQEQAQETIAQEKTQESTVLEHTQQQVQEKPALQSTGQESTVQDSPRQESNASTAQLKCLAKVKSIILIVNTTTNQSSHPTKESSIPIPVILVQLLGVSGCTANSLSLQFAFNHHQHHLKQATSSADSMASCPRAYIECMEWLPQLQELKLLLPNGEHGDRRFLVDLFQKLIHWHQEASKLSLRQEDKKQSNTDFHSTVDASSSFDFF